MGLDAAHTRTECTVQKFIITFRRIIYFILKTPMYSEISPLQHAEVDPTKHLGTYLTFLM